MSDRIKAERKQLEESGYSLYSISTTVGPSTLIMYNPNEKRFIFIVHDPDTEFYRRENIFLYMAETKAEIASKKSTPNYGVQKDEQGKWRIINESL